MAREVLTVAGAVVGAAFGNPQLGFLIGSMVGNAVDPQKIKGPSLGDAKVQTTQEGAPIPRVWGRAAVAGTVIDRGEPIRVKRETQQGKGGGPVTVEERELMTFAILIAEPIDSILRIWENDKLVYDAREDSTIRKDTTEFARNFTFYNGDESQLPDPTLEAIHGVGETPAYRGTSYVVFPTYDYTDKGMAIPRYLFECVSAAEVHSNPLYIRAVPFAGIGTERVGNSVTQLVFDSATSTEFSLTRTVYNFTTDAVDSTETVTIPKFGGFSNVGLALFYNSASYVRQRRNAAGTVDVSAWYQDELMLGSPVLPPVGTDSYNSAVAVTGTVIANGRFYNVGQVSGTYVTAWQSGASEPSHYYLIDASNYTSYVAADEYGYIWVAVPGLGNLYKFGPSLVLLETFTGAGSIAGGFCAYGGMIAAHDSSVLRVWDTSSGALVSIGTAAGGVDHAISLGDGYFTYNGALYRLLSFVEPSDVALSTILTGLHDRLGIESSEIVVSDHTATFVSGFVYGSAYTTAEAIRELGRAFLFDAYSADGKLRYPARGGASSFALTEDDLLEDPDILERRAEVELPRKFHLGYQDYDLNYATAKATSARTSPDIRVVGGSGIQTSVVMSGTQAIQLSEKLHKVMWVDLEGEFTIKVPDNFSYLTPTDCGTVTFRGITKRVRIERIESAEGVMTLTVRHDRESSYTSDAAPIIVRAPFTPPSTYVGETIWHFLNCPIFNDADDSLGYHVAGAGREAGWRGYQLERSVDAGVSYTHIQTYSSGSVIGYLLADLGDASRYVTDYQNELKLSLVGPSDTLESATRLQVLRSANAIAVLNSDGTCEIVQFQDVTEESDNVWVATTLLRGRKNTTASSHAIGSPCILLSTAAYVTADPALIGSDITHRPTSIGNSTDDSEEVTSTYDPAVNQTEWAPAYLRLTRSGDNLTAEWSPRPRLGTSAYPVHSANFLGYRVTLTKGANTVTFDQTDTTFTYDTSGLGVPTITVSIQGINRYTGAGDAVTDAL